MTEREFAISVVRRLQEAGHQALWAGGCVRDELLGLPPKDYDVASDARPEEVRRLFRRTVAVGISFGVVEVLGPRERPDLRVQVATFRSDVSYSDGRRPDEVVFSSPKEDALRRDFTINGMFYDPLHDRLLDFVGGQADLKAGVLRAIGDPVVRFTEDKLRLLRAVRLATRFDLTTEPATAAAIAQMAPDITVVSAERIAQELRQLLVHARRSRGLNLMFDLGLVAPTLPELVPMKGLPQGPPSAPTGDLWDHVMRVLDLLGPEPSFPLAMGALLHDVGKPRTIGWANDRLTFYHHEHVGARMADEIAVRLKLSNEERERIVWLVEKHQYLCDAKQMRTSKLKRILIDPGIRELLALHRADALAWGRSTEQVNYCEFLLETWGPHDLNPPAILTGHDLTRLFGLEPGPLFKELLDAVREAQLEGVVNTQQEAQKLVERLLELRPFFQGEAAALCIERDGRVASSDRAVAPPALLPGSFNPVHQGHWELAAVAERLLGVAMAFELSLLNVDKPPLEMAETQRRLAQFTGRAVVWLTRAPTFVDKARLFPGTTFVIGADTAERLVAPGYYPEGDAGVLRALSELREQRCRFLVAGRTGGDGVFHGLESVAIPAEFATMFTGIDRSMFQVDVCSTDLRRDSGTA